MSHDGARRLPGAVRRRPYGEKALAYGDALTSLRASQLLHRPRRLIPPRVLAAGLSRGDPSGWRPLATGIGVTSAPQSGPTPQPHSSGSFTAVGIQRLATGPDLWSPRGHLLFLFTLHSFDELPRYLAGDPNPQGDAFWTRMLSEWLAQCGRPSLPGWHPYPLSRRVVAWCAALSEPRWDAALRRRLLRSLHRQVHYLLRCVEHDIGGNHVLENAVALTVGGACLGSAVAARRGRRLLRRELARQLLADGGHEERSPSYHRHVLERLVDAQAVLGRAQHDLPELDAGCASMERWLAALAGPDGSLPRFNDGWDGPALAPSGDLVADMASSGYITLRAGGDQAVLDVGSLCPAHLPPHAHADALSFVLWADGIPIVVDPGSGAYHGEVRRWSRATASHSTVEIDGQDQCVFLGDFRAAHLPKVCRAPIERRSDAIVVRARHDGYHRLADPVSHRRTFCWLPGDGLVVVDVLSAAGAHRACSHLQLANAHGETGPLTVRALSGATVRRCDSRTAPYLGVFSTATVLEQETNTRERAVQGWSLLRSDADIRLDGDQVIIRRSTRPPVSFYLG